MISRLKCPSNIAGVDGISRKPFSEKNMAATNAQFHFIDLNTINMAVKWTSQNDMAYSVCVYNQIRACIYFLA